MLHELLAALCGFPGSVFCLNAKQEIQVIDNLPFCHPGERDVLNRICRIATAHYRLVEFVKRHDDAVQVLDHRPAISSAAQPTSTVTKTRMGDRVDTSSSPSSLTSGIYLRSFCVALDEAFLAPYAKCLVELELEYLNDPLLTVSHVQYRLEKYQNIFPALVRLTEEVTSRQAHGCYILELIHSHAASGLPNVSSVLKQIQRICHAVLIRNLIDWLLYGVLHDPFKEFFIWQDQQTTNDDEGEIEPSRALNIKDEYSLSSRRTTFHLNLQLLPSYISVDVAKIILFVGQSVHMFEQAPSINADKIDSISILQDKREMFARDLYDWQQNEQIQIAKFELIIDSIRSCVAEHLWTLVVEKSDLNGHLGSLKDYYLLGRGDLFMTFIEQADSLLTFPPTSNTQHLVSNTFQLVCRSMLPEDDAYIENFRLIVDTKKKDAIGWSHLRLKYNAPRPIHTIFTPEILNELNVMFQFLLNVKRVQLRLHQCWALRMQSRHLRLDTGDPKKWHLRNWMALFVDNLQYYLQVDVLENQFNILLAKIKETRDFQQVQMAFHSFMTNIRMQTFILMKSVFQHLNEFLDLCTSYCCSLHHQQSVRFRSDNNDDDEEDPDDKHMLATYSTQFKRYSMLLLKVLSGIRTHQVAPHVAQFLIRVNFNQFFSNGQDSL